jgi:hypothetical protein
VAGRGGWAAQDCGQRLQVVEWSWHGTRFCSPGVQRTHGTHLLPCVGGCPPIPRHATHTLLAQVSELLEPMGDGATVAPPAVLDASAADATPRSPTGSPATAASAVPLRQLVPEPAPVPTPERAPGPTLESVPEPASVARPKTSTRSPRPDTAAARQPCRKCRVDFSGAQCPERHAMFMYVAPRNESSRQPAPTEPATSELSPSAEYGCARRVRVQRAECTSARCYLMSTSAVACHLITRATPKQ